MLEYPDSIAVQAIAGRVARHGPFFVRNGSMAKICRDRHPEILTAPGYKADRNPA
jgi:hypothetical protein